MRKLALLCSALLLCGVLAFAQQKTVTGKVTDDKGDPVPFATVKIKNGKAGTTADENGNFSIKVPPGAVLTFNSVGFASKEAVVKGDNLMLSLTRTDLALSEVIVTTALNIKRKADALSYSQQGIKGENLTKTRLTDINTALAGKIAGLQVRSQSGAKLGAAGSVRLRGVTGLGDASALFVLDGTPINSIDINPDDVDDIQVLKGPTATALYGQRAEGGVIMVTSKRGKKRAGLGVDVTSTYEVDKVGLLPRYQNDYSGGAWLGANSAGTEFQKFTYDATSMPAEWKTLDGKYYHLYNDDASWGPRMAGQEYIPWYAWYPNTQYTGKTAKLTPQPNNIRDFWNGNGAGQLINNVSVGKAGDNYNFRLSYTNINQTGLLPSTSRKKNYVSANLGYDINSHFTAGININYTNETLNGEFDDTYGNNSSGGFSQWFHRDLDMSILKQFRNYRTPDGVLPSWNLNDGNGINGKTSSDPAAFLRPNYWFDHYSYFDNISNVTNRNRVAGDVNLTYKFNSHFKIAAFLRKNVISTDNEARVPLVLEMSNDGSSAEVLTTSATSPNRPIKSTYQTTYTFASEDNYEVLGSYSQKFNNFLVDFNLGANQFLNVSKSVYNSTKGGLTIPNLFALNNSINPIAYTNNRFKNERRSFYGRGSVGWKDIAVVDFSLRNDITSTLAPNNNSYFYGSLGGSLILTKLVTPTIPFISFAKLRASWAQVGTDIGAYAINTIYTLNASLWNGNALTTTPDQLVDPNIKPTISSSYEGGIDLRFLKDRISLNATYYTQKSKNQIISAPITGASGFSSKLINAGEIDKHGIEIVIDATPIRGKDFRWDINLNLAKTSVKIISLAPGVHQLYSGGGSYTSTTGNPAYAPGAWQFDTSSAFGNKFSQLIGIGIQKYNGTPVLSADGQYVPTTSNVSFGSTIPDFTGGITNSFTYKNFNLSFLVDFVKGGKYYSLSDFWGKVSGLYDVTAGLNDKGIPIRNNVSDGGGVHVTGVDASTNHSKIDTYVDAGTYYHQFYNHFINENSIYDLTYVKMREISFGYRLPLNKMGKTMSSTFQNITISAVCHNAFLFYTANKNIDPSELVGGYGESGQLPPTRSIGLTLKLGL